MKIETTKIEYNYNGSKIAGDNAHGEYVFHNMDAYNEIIIDGITLQAVYQTGMTFCHNSYSCPSNKFELSNEGGASNLLVQLEKLQLFDIEMGSEDARAVLDALRKIIPSASMDDLLRLYIALNENQPASVFFYLPKSVSDNVEDYRKKK